jgi:hypothetical protein
VADAVAWAVPSGEVRVAEAVPVGALARLVGVGFAVGRQAASSIAQRVRIEKNFRRWWVIVFPPERRVTGEASSMLDSIARLSRFILAVL